MIADWEGIEHSTTPGAAGNYFAGEAVQKNLVILKNNKVLPPDTNGKVFVTGSHVLATF